MTKAAPLFDTDLFDSPLVQVRWWLPAVSPQTRICRTCGEQKSVSEFYKQTGLTKSGAVRFGAHCKMCISVAHAEGRPLVAKPRSPDGMKVCSLCKTEKSVDEFYSVVGILKGGGLFYSQPCKSCRQEAVDRARANAVGIRSCRSCGETKPAAQFRVTHISKSGVPSFHLDCMLCLARNITPNPRMWAVPDAKACRDCKVTKTITDFPIRRIRKDGEPAYQTRCKPCYAKVAKRRTDRATERARVARGPKPTTKVCITCQTEKPLGDFWMLGKARGKECVQCHETDIADRKAAREAIRLASTRLCKECGETKPIDQFAKRRYKCKDCHNVVQRVYGRKWTANNQPGQRQKERRRRAAKKGAEGTHTAEDVARIRKLQGDKCCMPWCRKKLRGKGHVEHRTPLWAGGSDDARNLQLACGPCNSSKGVRDEIDFVQSRNAPIIVGQLRLL